MAFRDEGLLFPDARNSAESQLSTLSPLSVLPWLERAALPEVLPHSHANKHGIRRLGPLTLSRVSLKSELHVASAEVSIERNPSCDSEFENSDGINKSTKFGNGKVAFGRNMIALDLEFLNLGENGQLWTPQTIQQTLKRTLQYYEHQVMGFGALALFQKQQEKCQPTSDYTAIVSFSPHKKSSSYRDAEKNFHNISNRCSYADHSNKEEIEDISGILQCTANILGLKFEEIQERFGEEFFNICFDENERVLRAVGGTLQDFFNGFDALLEHIRTSFGKQATLESPSFLCKELPEGTLMLHYFHPHHTVGFAMLGMIKAAGKKIYRLDVDVEQVASEKLCSDGSNPGNCSCLTFLIKECENTNITKNLPQGTSQVPADLRISINTFCRAFPFHLMFDPNMSVLQLGEGLRKQFRCDTHKVLKFEDCFEIVSPKVNATFERVLLRLSTPFVIRTKPEASGTENKDKVMEVKGQMIHVPESNSILFLGSPCVDKLDELMGRGLHLSDIPIHDATRDVILVGEQAKAQDGLKKRMDKLKATLERTHQALEEEKKKTVDLLYSIFPGDVAQQLWQGQQVQARKFDDVTMLFSDIVGFTAICAQCTPMQVISMLNELYTRFDHQCGFLDIYKVIVFCYLYINTL
ncbi:PREDICTED: guanylate cyclase soluble subunit alpha-2 [Galeopterus variegatus]|uniref:guanylate cyclase n=1 Tax=Galeopterus variegatus TaxID=482537 RepID=A0ABM0RWS1_GALVR|nr:PREDICTED: guanylate cyclase soluble subunit alpha-2 [Galeopterus variegatus]